MKIILILLLLSGIAVTAGCGPSPESKYNEALVRYNAEQVALENLHGEKQSLYETMTNDETYRSRAFALLKIKRAVEQHIDAKAPPDLLAKLKTAEEEFDKVAKPFRTQFTVLNKKIGQQEERIKLAERDRDEAEKTMRPH